MFDRVVAEPARVALVRRRAVLVVAAAVALVYAAVLGAALPVLGRHALHGIIHAIGSTAFAALLLWESAKRDFVVQNGELTISGWFGIGTGVRSNVREAHLETIEREVLYRPSVELRWVVSGRGYVMNTHLREHPSARVYDALASAMRSPDAIEALVALASAHADEQSAELRRLGLAAVVSLAALTWFLAR